MLLFGYECELRGYECVLCGYECCCLVMNVSCVVMNVCCVVMNVCCVVMNVCCVFLHRGLALDACVSVLLIVFGLSVGMSLISTLLRTTNPNPSTIHWSHP
jgi:hypothetical protein